MQLDDKPQRLKVLDFLRAVAVFLVLFRHYGFVDVLQRIGWIGVDLFFVLSGFLVSGLLFKEFRQYGTIDAKRFLIRRGLKIYPLFYLAIILTVGANLLFVNHGFERYQFNASNVFAEIFFVQNYFNGLWSHTWSLAVEEHFYLLLVLVIFILIKKERINARSFNIGFILIAVTALSLRLYKVHFTSNPWPTLFQSHVRIDSLLFGVWLAYHYHFNHDKFVGFFKKYKAVVAVVFILILLPLFVFELDHPYTLTIQLTLLYLGFGGVLGIALVLQNSLDKFPPLSIVTNIIARVGVYSYSIYLFHLFIPKYFIPVLVKTFSSIPTTVLFVAYFGSAIILGVGLSRLIEIPILKFRDRIFRSRG